MTSTIKLSKDTLDTFKKLYDIDQSLKIVADSEVIRSKSHNNTMMAKVSIKEKFPRDFHIYDLRELISVIGIVNEPELDFSNDKFVTIKSADGKQKLRYLEGSPDLITSFIDKEIQLSSEDVEVTVTEDQFKSILTAAQTLKLDFIGFVGEEGNLRISAFNKNNGDENETNNFSIELAETDDVFRMFYKLDVHNIGVLLGEGKLSFTIDAKKKISKVDTETGKVFFVAMDSKSEFND